MHLGSSKKSPSPPRAGAAPPPPPPPSAGKAAPAAAPALKTPVVPQAGPPGALMVELLIYNGFPFKDHWAYWVHMNNQPNVGVLIHAAGNVKDGFTLEFKRNLDFRHTKSIPTKRIPLQWVDGKFFNVKAMFNDGRYIVDNKAVCPFEASASKIKAPQRTLNAVDDKVLETKAVGKKITQRNCQTWIVESADQLVKDHIFTQEVATYLHAIKQ